MGSGTLPGGLALVLGSFSFFGATTPASAGFSWLANPVFLVSLLSWRWPVLRKVAAALALLLACLFFGVVSIAVDEGGGNALASPGPGFFFWLQSMVLLNVWVWLKRPVPREKF